MKKILRGSIVSFAILCSSIGRGDVDSAEIVARRINRARALGCTREARDEWLRIADKYKNVTAQYWAGKLSLEIHPKNIRRAFRLFEEAGDQGNLYCRSQCISLLKQSSRLKFNPASTAKWKAEAKILADKKPLEKV